MKDQKNKKMKHSKSKHKQHFSMMRDHKNTICIQY